ncbi:kinetochore protein animal type [Nannochloropsis oceanica]
MAATAEQLARSFTQDITETQARLDTWLESSKADLEGLETRHGKALAEMGAERATLLARQAELKNKTEEGARLSQQDQEALSAVEAEIAALKEKERALPQELATAREREEELRQVLAGKRAALGSLTSRQGEYINDLTRGVVMYKHLGLDFERADDNKLRLIFTQLDSSNPGREFFFSVHIDENDQYRVEECVPALDVGMVEGLVGEVNKANDFATFVKKMRRAFKVTIGSN